MTLQFMVIGLMPDQEEAFDVERGRLIDVVGFVSDGHQTSAIWVDFGGRLHQIPIWALQFTGALSSDASERVA